MLISSAEQRHPLVLHGRSWNFLCTAEASVAILTKSRGSLLQSRARPDVRRDSLTWRAQFVSAAANSMRFSTAGPEVFLPDSASGIGPGPRRFDLAKGVRSTYPASYSSSNSAVLLDEESLSMSLEPPSGLGQGPCGDFSGEMQELGRVCKDNQSSMCSLLCSKNTKNIENGWFV